MDGLRGIDPASVTALRSAHGGAGCSSPISKRLRPSPQTSGRVRKASTMDSRSAFAWSDVSTGIFPRVTAYFGPRIALAGFNGPFPSWVGAFPSVQPWHTHGGCIKQ